MSKPFNEIIDPVWKLSKKKLKDDSSTTGFEIIEYKSDGAKNISNPNLNPIIIRSKDSAGFYLYQDSYTVVDLKLTIANGDDIPDEDTALVKTGALFNRSVYKINERVVTDHQNYHIGNLINILTREFDTYDTYGTAEYWYTEQTTRRRHAKESITIAIKIPVRKLSAFMRSFKKISMGLIHSMELSRNSNASSILTTVGGVTRLVEIIDVTWFVPKYKPSHRAKALLGKFFLASSVFTVGFQDWNVYPSATIETGRLNLEYAITTLGYKPNQVFTVLRPDNADIDNQVDSMALLNANLSNANIFVNGQKFMRNRYNTDFTTATPLSNYQKLYDEFLKYRGKHLNGTLVSYEDFKSNNMIIRFDVSSIDKKFIKDQDTNDFIVELRFRTGLEAPVIAYSLVTYDRIINIKSSKYDNKLIFTEPALQPFP